MENILAMTEGSTTSEITSLDKTDHNVFQDCLQKVRSGTFMKYVKG